MSVIATVHLPAAGFALEETLASHGDVTFDIERVVAHEDGHVLPYLWASGESVETETLVSTLEADPTVDNLELLAAIDGEWLFRMEWIDKIHLVVHVLVESEGTILDARGSDAKWHMRVLFPSREALSRTYDYCEAEGIDLVVDQIYALDESQNRGQYGLTEEQHDALVAAFDMGYYEVPRGITATDLAAELGISHQALSERLRRGHKNLVGNALVVGGTE